MQSFRNILVGVDLSSGDRLAAAELNSSTRVAVERAIWLAQRTRSKLTFFAVLDVSPQTEELLANDTSGTRSIVETAAADALEELVAQAKLADVEAASGFVFGTSWLELIRKVLRDQHDLVIVGTRGLSISSRMIFGSTGIKLLRKCPCPVWVTRPDPVPEDLNILVASDLGEVSEDALQIAVRCGQLVEETYIHVVHAAELKQDRRMWLSGMSDEDFETHRRQRIEQAETALHEQLSQTDYRTLKNGVKVHVEEGPADVVILDAIEEYGIDLLIMGTIARSGVPGLLVGNTAERVLSQADCSVVAIKPEDFICPVTLS